MAITSDGDARHAYHDYVTTGINLDVKPLEDGDVVYNPDPDTNTEWLKTTLTLNPHLMR